MGNHSISAQSIRPLPAKRGFILAAAIAILFIMAGISTTLPNKTRSMQTFTMNTQTETLETEGASYALAQLRGMLQGSIPPGFGLPGPLAATGDISGSPPASDANFTGKLSYNKLSDPTGPDGYATVTPANGASSISIPTCHSSVLLTASVDSDSIKQKFIAIFTSNFPYGVLAANGAATIKSLRSVNDLDGEDTHMSGLMANVYGVTVALGAAGAERRLHGRAFSKGTVTGGTDWIVYPNWPNAVAIPSDFLTSLNNFKATLAAGPFSSSLSGYFDDLHKALHRDFSADITATSLSEAVGPGVFQPASYVDPSGGKDSVQATVTSPGSTDYDNAGGTLTVGTSLRIPNGEKQKLTFTQINITGDLLLTDNSVFYVTGNLQVTGKIRLGKNATLQVDGSTSSSGLSVTYKKADLGTNTGMCSTIYSKCALAGFGSMSQGTSTTWIGTPILPTSPPFPLGPFANQFLIGPPPSIVVAPHPNLAAISFAAFQAADVITLAELLPYLGNQLPPPSELTVDVPGMFLLSDSSITIGSGAKAVGLFYAPTVFCSATRMVGAMWANNEVNAPNTDVRFFPYYTHAFPHTASGNSTVSATYHHPTAYGKYP